MSPCPRSIHHPLPRLWALFAACVSLLAASNTSARPHCPLEPKLDVELRQTCDIVASGVRRLPGDTRYLRIAVLQLGGADRSVDADRSRRMVSDYLAIDCLERQHRLSTVPQVLRGSTDDSIESIRTAVAGLDVQVVVTGELTRAPEGYATSIRVIALESGTELTSAMRTLPEMPLDGLAACVLEPRRGSALMRSALAPGWGQIYNGQVLEGALLLTLETALLGGALGSELAGRGARARYDEGVPRTVDENDKAQQHFDRRTLLLGVAAGVWVYAMIDAYLGGYVYQPQDAHRIRVQLEPTGGAGLGGTWHF